MAVDVVVGVAALVDVGVAVVLAVVVAVVVAEVLAVVIVGSVPRLDEKVSSNVAVVVLD